MHLNISTDYAIRMVLFLAKHTKKVSSSKLSKEIGISSRYLLQIAAKLRDAGIVDPSHGSGGGYELARPAKDINLFDIILVMEERIQSKQDSHREADSNSELFQIVDTAYAYVDHVIGEMLKSVTFESLVSQSVEGWYLVPYLLEQKKKK